MIKSIKIHGLNGQERYLEYHFNEDLNILTGQNGCGKTTLLKILWYINSGMISRLDDEIRFDIIEVEIGNHLIIIKKSNEEVCSISIDGEIRFDRESDREKMSRIGIRSRYYLDRCFYTINKEIWASIFFPTFRRIEGGFFMDDDISDAFRNYSDQMSNERHKFIASVSTKDIDDYLRIQYSSISKESLEVQQNTFNQIKKLIKDNTDGERDIQTHIGNLIKKSETQVKTLKKPFDILKKAMLSILHHKGIQVDNFLFGEEKGSISSNKLSAGEKQMLSFLCYNAFARNTIIFIDEPELSLHPDWQRRLMPTLLRQGTGNQYIIATHSPFIYSQFPDKEIEMDQKGE